MGTSRTKFRWISVNIVRVVVRLILVGVYHVLVLIVKEQVIGPHSSVDRACVL